MHDRSTDPQPLIDVTFFAPTQLERGSWNVIHADGTVLFTSALESQARARLLALRAHVAERIAAGHAVTGADLLVLWPPNAPAALLSAHQATADTLAGSRGSGTSTVLYDTRGAAAPAAPTTPFDLAASLRETAEGAEDVRRRLAVLEAGDGSGEYVHANRERRSQLVAELGDALARRAGANLGASAELIPHYKRARDLLEATLPRAAGR